MNKTALAGVPLFLETNGYLLRSLTPGDVSESFLTWINSPVMMEGLNLSPINLSAQHLADYIKRFDNSSNYFIGIFDRAIIN